MEIRRADDVMQRRPKVKMDNQNAANSTIKSILEEPNFAISNQPVWNNDKIVTFFDIGGVDDGTNSDGTRHSPQGMTTDQFLSQNSLRSKAPVHPNSINRSLNSLKRNDGMEIELTPAEDDLVNNESEDEQSTGQSTSLSSGERLPNMLNSNFDPATRHFSPEELKPTPIQRKSRKTLTKDADKDTRYWDKRRKNNLAAKRSREARRSRENQISMRASFLEKDNAALKEELLTVKEELQSLKEKLITVQQHREMSHNKCQSFHQNNN